MEDILDHMRTAYKDLDNPYFFFVSSAIESNPYHSLIEEIQQSFEVEEDTDPNYDVSFGYNLSRGNRQWALRLSMVGPYAELVRVTPSDGVEVVSPARPLDATEQQLLDLMARHRIRVLTQDELEQHAPINLQRLFDLEPRDTRMFQALFIITEYLPWRET